MKGKIHSFFAGGTVDGPGIRYVIFLKGCPLKCRYCHNPDTQSMDDAKLYEADLVADMALKYKGYFGTNGGVTVTGGEPMLQIDFLIELFKILKKNKIHTCIDTSGITYNSNSDYLIKLNELMKYTDLVLLDIKHIDTSKHEWLTGKPNDNILAFARYLDSINKPVWIRHVIVPKITLIDEYLYKLKDFIDTLSNVEKIEVLPYHKMGISKYEELGIEYTLKDIDEPTKDMIRHAKKILGVIKDVD